MDIRLITTQGYQLWPCSEGPTTSGVSAISYIWNGTGTLDVNGDWTHQYYGIESSAAKHTGTNGLDASGMASGDKIWFNAPNAVDGNLYDSLVMWINLRQWQVSKDIDVQLHTSAGTTVSVNLRRYLTTDTLNVWRKVSIPLTHFGNIGAFDIDSLRLLSSGNIGLWMDDSYFSMGAIVGVAVCDPEMTASESGQLLVHSKSVSPTVKATDISIVPQVSVPTSLVPDMVVRDTRITPVVTE